MEGCNPNSGESKNVSSDDTGTVRKVLKEALKQNTFGEGGFAGDRILCIGLNGKEQGFKPAFLSSGLSQAELIAVLELCSTYLKADICSQNLQLFNVEE